MNLRDKTKYRDYNDVRLTALGWPVDRVRNVIRPVPIDQQAIGLELRLFYVGQV